MTITKISGTIITPVAPATSTTYNSPKLQVLKYIIVDLPDGDDSSSNKGKILSSSANPAANEASLKIQKFISLKQSQIMIPGFIDTHTHAPQFVNSGIGLDMELLQWLEKYTFPAEAKCSDVTNFARPLFDKAVKTHLQFGSTTCVYFSTIHVDASLELARICQERGQRAFVGKVNMDRNSPDFYVEKDAQESLDATRKFVKGVLDMTDVPETESKELATPSYAHRLVTPILTPRFVPTCTEKLMRGLGDIAKEFNLPIQSHVSENMGEILWVQSLHPNSKSYSHVYDEMGLLTDKTIMAHGIYLTDEELTLLAERKTTISHCPLSNYCLQSGNLDVRRLLNAGINVAIGTDVSGGYSASMLNAVRNTLIASTVNRFAHRDDMKNVDQYVKRTLAHANASENNDDKDDDKDESKTEEIPSTLSIPELLYMSTLAGAKSLQIDHVTGSLEVGKEFDALLVDVNDLVVSDPENDSDEDKLQRFLMLGDDRQIKSIWVRGRCVHGEDKLESTVESVKSA